MARRQFLLYAAMAVTHLCLHGVAARMLHHWQVTRAERSITKHERPTPKQVRSAARYTNRQARRPLITTAAHKNNSSQ